MRRTRGRMIEIDSLSEFDRRLAAGVTSLRGWHVHGVDLRARADVLGSVDVFGAVFVGCHLDDPIAVQRRGAVVLARDPGLPAALSRTGLYSPRELYDTTEYAASFDARVYAWSRLPADRDASLARALHDVAVDNALEEWRQSRRLVGIMGGHAVPRNHPTYAAAARLGRALSASFTVATGGGPGAMEAANLGALTSRSPESVLDGALDRLGQTPSYRPDVGAWVAAAAGVLDTVAEPVDSLGIPTWHYGHEPSNAFATAIAKYFRNATREAILLEICQGGIVFLPGAAGTVQEIFQDACENYYADVSSVAPMVLVGREHWTERFPAWPLLAALASDRAMAPHVHLADSVEEAAAFVVG